MNSPIRTVTRQLVESRTEASIPAAWVRHDIPRGQLPNTPWLSEGAPTRVRALPNDPVLVMLGIDNRDAVARATLALAKQGARIYMLVEPSWGNGSDELGHGLGQAREVLVRRVPEVPCSAILDGRHPRAWIGGGLALHLCDAQAEALRQTFLREFWHEATHEAWSDNGLVWRAAAARPFDVPELPDDAAIRREPSNAKLRHDLRGAIVHLAGSEPPPTKLAPRQLWLSAGGQHHGRLSQLARAGTEIGWEDRALPDLVLGDQSGELLLPGSRGRLRIRLEPGQRDALAQLLEAPSSWRFETDLRVGDPRLRGAALWLSDEAQARPLQAEQQIELASVAASSLRELPETSPEHYPPAQPLALAVCYRWDVVPPRAPKGTREDALIGRWRELDADWGRRLNDAAEALEKVGDERGRLGRTIERLVRALLGFQRTHDQLELELAQLQAERPSLAGPSDAPDLFDRLAQLEAQIAALRGALDKAEQQAREDDERERQQRAWQTRGDELERELPLRRTELTEAEARQQQLELELATVAAEPKPANKQAKHDRNARKLKLTDELTRANKRVEGLRATIQALETERAQPFEYRPSASRPARSNPTNKRANPHIPPKSDPGLSVTVPKEAVPDVGSLCTHKGRRYLVIDSWSQLDAGERAANRLSATLVASENA